MKITKNYLREVIKEELQKTEKHEVEEGFKDFFRSKEDVKHDKDQFLRAYNATKRVWLSGGSKKLSTEEIRDVLQVLTNHGEEKGYKE